MANRTLGASLLAALALARKGCCLISDGDSTLWADYLLSSSFGLNQSSNTRRNQSLFRAKHPPRISTETSLPLSLP